MIETFTHMEFMHQAYWLLAAVASVIFIIQAIMTFMGFDADSDVDLANTPDTVPEGGGADFDADGFHLVSVKSIICFILGFGWTGVLLWDSISSRLVLGLVACLVGLCFMSLIAFLLFQVMKLNRDNTFRVDQVIGLNADVYLRIPAERRESGKISVSLHGSMHELEAMTADTQDIPTGAKVRITALAGSNVVLVERL